MIFDVYDIEFLKLCGLCRYIPTGLLRKYDAPYFNGEIISTLRRNGYIKIQTDGSSYKLTYEGREILSRLNYPFEDDPKMNITKKSYKRKLKNALWNILLHLAGINIFAEKTVSLAGKDVGYVSSLVLRGDINVRVLAGTRFLGILKIFDTVYIPYYVEGQDDWIVPKHETEIYKSQVNLLKGVRDIKIILTGDTLEELWKTVHPVREGEELKRGMRRFDRALEEIGCDYLLVPSNREGVAQLEIMKVWRYREKIAEALGCNTDKQSNLSECDGFKDNHPYIIAIDFNIKRILRALKQIEKYDAESEPRICCFPFQKKTMFKLLSKYDAPKSLVVTLDKNNIYDIVLGSVPKPPKQKPYMTKESEYINANQRKPAKADIKEFKS